MSNTPPAAGETGDRTGRYVRHPNGHVAPMSPFTDIWRWHMTMVASILFRVTIGAASVGAVLSNAFAFGGLNAVLALRRA